MGDPKRLRKRYQPRRHPWKEEVIKKEKGLVREYALKNRKEVWRMNYTLKKMKDEAKRLIAARTIQGKKEAEQLLERLARYGLLSEKHLENVLDLDVEAILDRRLQSILFKNGFAKSMKQARQFITHGHISIGDKKIAHPNYLLTKEEETKLRFNPSSPLSDEDHPERKREIAEEKRPSAEKTEDMPSKSDDLRSSEGIEVPEEETAQEEEGAEEKETEEEAVGESGASEDIADNIADKGKVDEDKTTIESKADIKEKESEAR